MAQCAFYTAAFTRCLNGAHHAHGDYCRVHAHKAERLGARPPAGMCVCVRRVGGQDQWCGQPFREGQTICDWHWERMQRRDLAQQNRANHANFLRDQVRAYMDEDPRRTWQQVMEAVRQRMEIPRDMPGHLTRNDGFIIARRYFAWEADPAIPMTAFVNAWFGIEEDAVWVAPAPPQAPPVQPLGQMGRLAADGQNVHTQAVSRQTNGNVDLLLAEEVKSNQDTLAELTMWWFIHKKGGDPAFEEFWKVMEDVRFWYHKRTCKATNDFLYKRVLDGLVAKIREATYYPGSFDETNPKQEMLDELAKRLWEECSEAVGMCCEGHVSRLANVLVGFDDTFRPPIPVGEILQQKMAAIAELKLSPRHKLQRAMEVMEELHIPVDERAPWLEALEE